MLSYLCKPYHPTAYNGEKAVQKLKNLRCIAVDNAGTSLCRAAALSFALAAVKRNGRQWMPRCVQLTHSSKPQPRRAQAEAGRRA